MPELRKDPVVGRWVIIATERGKRPGDFVSQPIDVPEQARNPFAEGNEHMTPPEIFAFRDPKSKANAPGWQVRVVPNKFPALRIEGDLDNSRYWYRRAGKLECVDQEPMAELSSIKAMMDIFDMLEAAHAGGRTVSVTWYYDSRNERVAELAEEFKEDCTFPFAILPRND